MAETPANEGVTSRTLLQKASERDPDAWQRLMHLYRPLIVTWCLRGGVKFDDADDVVQEVFRAALVRLPDFRRDRQGDTFRGWLRVITRNQVIVHYRKAKGPAAVGGSTANMAMAEVPDSFLEEDDSPAEVNSLYRRALELVRSEFEARTWEMFWLVVVEEKSTAEVAERLQVSAAAVRQAKARVLRRLKDEVGDVL